MSVLRKYYRADFDIIEDKEGEDYSLPFVFKYYCEDNPGQIYIVSNDDNLCLAPRCELLTDGSLKVIFDNQHMGIGKLVCEKNFFNSDDDYSDGNLMKSYVDKSYNIELVKVLTNISGSYDKESKKLTITTEGGDAGVDGDKIKLNGLGVELKGETIIL